MFVIFSCRFHAFLLFLGHPIYGVRDLSVHRFSKILSEFALEYRTTRERVLQQKQKRANHRERNKTRGKMITDVSGQRTLLLNCASISFSLSLWSLNVNTVDFRVQAPNAAMQLCDLRHLVNCVQFAPDVFGLSILLVTSQSNL